MYFRLSNGTAFLTIVLLSYLATKNSFAQQPQQDVVLQVKPAMCVALNQGRTCFAQITIQWNTPISDDFCIFQKQTKQVLKCWKNSKGSSISFEFESSEALTYQLINTKDEPLAETTVDVSWVHKKSPRKRRWRLF